MAEEISVYQDANIHVTNLRAMLQGKTYAMANITSVSMFTRIKSRAPGLILAFLGAAFFLLAFGSRDLRGCSFLRAAARHHRSCRRSGCEKPLLGPHR